MGGAATIRLRPIEKDSGRLVKRQTSNYLQLITSDGYLYQFFKARCVQYEHREDGK